MNYIEASAFRLFLLLSIPFMTGRLLKLVQKLQILEKYCD